MRWRKARRHFKISPISSRLWWSGSGYFSSGNRRRRIWKRHKITFAPCGRWIQFWVTNIDRLSTNFRQLLFLTMWRGLESLLLTPRCASSRALQQRGIDWSLLQSWGMQSRLQKQLKHAGWMRRNFVIAEVNRGLGALERMNHVGGNLELIEIAILSIICTILISFPTNALIGNLTEVEPMCWAVVNLNFPCSRLL